MVRTCVTPDSQEPGYFAYWKILTINDMIIIVNNSISLPGTVLIIWLAVFL